MSQASDQMPSNGRLDSTLLVLNLSSESSRDANKSQLPPDRVIFPGLIRKKAGNVTYEPIP